MSKLDVVIYGSSRPVLAPFMLDAFEKMCIIRSEKRIFFHEDFVIPSESQQTVKWCEEKIAEGRMDAVYQHNPCTGLGNSMDYMFRKHVTAPYFFNLQEDWEFERPVDIDHILWVMDHNPEVNCVIFNKIRNTGSLNGASQPQFTYGGLDMCLYHSWSFMPGIWRMEHIMKYWKVRVQRPEGFISNIFGTHKERMDDQLCIDKIGAYLYGPSGDWRYVRHIGNDWRMAEWRLENGKPSGAHDRIRMDDPYRADWVEHTVRPTYKPNQDEEEIQRQIDEQAK
jgi:hypothetical protein